MSDARIETRPRASAVAWEWRDRGAGPADHRAREARANRVRGLIGAAVGWGVAALFQFVFHRPTAALVVAGVAVVVALLALVSPLGAYAALSRVLDRFARAVASVVTWVLMTVLFYLVFLPVGLVLRARGSLRIARNADRRLPTYWVPTEGRETPLESYRRQF